MKKANNNPIYIYLDKDKLIDNTLIINNFVGGLSFYKANALNYLLLASTYNENEPELIYKALQIAYTNILDDNLREYQAFNLLSNIAEPNFEKRKKIARNFVAKVKIINEDLHNKMLCINNYNAIDNEAIKLLIFNFYKFCLEPEFTDLEYEEGDEQIFYDKANKIQTNYKHNSICEKIQTIIKKYEKSINNKKPLSFLQKIKNNI